MSESGKYRLCWLQEFIDRDRQARREIRGLERLIDRLLDAHGTTLRDEDGVGPIAAATLLCEVGDRFGSLPNPSLRAGVALALLLVLGEKGPVWRCVTGSILVGTEP